MDGVGEGSFFDLENRVKKELDCIDVILKTGDIDHILGAYGVINSIKESVDSTLSGISDPVKARIESVYLKVQGLIPEGKEEVEGNFLNIGDTELLVTKGGVLVFLGDKVSIVPCEKNELGAIGNLIKFKKALPVAQGQIKALMKVVDNMNQKFNGFGVYFGVVNNEFFASDKEILSDNTPEKPSTSSLIIKDKEKTEIYIIHSNTLVFGDDGGKQVDIKIFSPIKTGPKTDIKIVIGGQEKVFKPAAFKLLLELLKLSNDQGVSSTSATSKTVLGALNTTEIELVGTNSNLRLALRDESLEKITYLHASKTPFPEFSEIEDTTIFVNKKPQDIGSKGGSKDAGSKKGTNTPDSSSLRDLIKTIGLNEDIQIFVRGIEVKTLSKVHRRGRDYYKIKVGNQEIELNQGEFGVLQTLNQKLGRPFRFTGSSLVALRALNKKLPDNFINNLRGAGHYLGEYRESDIESGGFDNDPNGGRFQRFVTPIPYVDIEKSTDEEFKEFCSDFILKSPGVFFTVEKISSAYKGKVEFDQLNISFLMAISSINGGGSQVINHPNKGYIYLPEELYSKFYTHSFDAESEIGGKITLYYAADIDCIFYDGKIFLEPSIVLNYCSISYNTLKAETHTRATEVLRQATYSSGTSAYLSVGKKGIHDKKGNPIKFKKVGDISEEQQSPDDDTGSGTDTTGETIPPKELSEVGHTYFDYLKGLSFYIGKHLFSIEEADGFDYYVLKCNSEIITDKFLLSPTEKQSFEDLITGKSGSLNTHIKNKLEQNTPLSIKRLDCKVVIYIKDTIATPEENLIKLENGYRFLVGGVRCELIKNQPGGKEKGFATLSAVGGSGMSVTVSPKLFDDFQTLLDNYKAERFIILEGGKSTITGLQSRFLEIGVRNFYEARKEGNTSRFRLKA